MKPALRRSRQIIEREVAVRDTVETVSGRPIEAERIGHGMAVDGKAGAGERRAAQRALVHPRPRIREARGVAAQHLKIRHQMMTQSHGLGDLQVRKAGHDRLGMLLRAADEHALKVADRVRRFVASRSDPQPEVGRDLVVARARGMQPSRPAPISSPGGARPSCGCPRDPPSRERRRAHIRQQSGRALREWRPRRPPR